MRRDYLLLLSARLVRAFGFGLGTVILGLHLERKGLAAAQIGAALAIGLGAGALSGLVAAPLSRRLGRRPVLALTGVLMLMTGVDLAFAHSPWLLLPAGLTGMLGGRGSTSAPSSPWSSRCWPRQLTPAPATSRSAATRWLARWAEPWAVWRRAAPPTSIAPASCSSPSGWPGWSRPSSRSFFRGQWRSPPHPRPVST